MLNKNFLLILTLGMLIYSCEVEDYSHEKQTLKQNAINYDSHVQGYLRIKLSESLAKEFEKSADEKGVVKQTAVKSVNQAISGIKVTKIYRTFPYAGRFEPRTRKEGLHLWYEVYFEKSIHLSKAADVLSQIEGVVDVEYRPKIKLIGNSKITKANIDQYTTTKSAPFNDPKLAQQWHYYNDGSFGGSVAGSDINVFPVWKDYTSGSSNVIVAIVDGGIDYEHEDLSTNIWINEAEFNGSRGVDDDKNGYVDDIRGFNFVASSGNIIAEDHGTHVAGTVGAVNNNGVGVCGVAGGDFANNVMGVRLMSCQIFEGENGSGSGATAIKYGADNGAVISQNSWGYDGGNSTPTSDKAAIDYFRKYAGVDENGVQVGPMKGGIVVFAAGNDNLEVGYPAEYEGALAVASIAQDYKRAYYSNYGAWVDISAPGGDYQKGGMILSTIPGNQYGTMQGTSMACPHVSGVAALIVSYFGGPGFTNDMLWNRIVSTSKNIDEYNRALTGKLGTGLIDVFASVASSSTIPPSSVSGFSVTSASNNIFLQWTVPSDPDDLKPYGFTVYYSKSSLEGFDRSDMTNVSTISFETGSLSPGDIVKDTISGLDFDSNYNLVIDAYDYSLNRSTLSSIASVSTLSNGTPTITALDGTTVNIKAYQTAILKFAYSDPDNHPVTLSVSPSSPAVTLNEVTGGVQVSVIGKNVPAGSYQTTLTVADLYGASSSIQINYTIAQNFAPVVLEDLSDIVIGAVGRKLTFNLNDIFSDGDGEPLAYTIQSSVPSVAHINPSNGQLYVTATSFGLTEVQVTATDVLGETCSTNFKILVRDENQPVDMYPNPVVDFLRLRTAEETTAKVSIVGSTGATVFEGSLNVSPFNPAQIDMSKVSGGVYTVIVEFSGKSIKTNIVKL